MRSAIVPIETVAASWFETRGVAALLTMRVWDLILRSRSCGVSKDESPVLKPLTRLRILAARCARGLLELVPLKEGAGKTGCALHPRSRVQMHIKKRTRAYRFSGNTPAFPAQWLYDLSRALPGERLFCLRRRRDIPANLTPAPRRRDHTTSPYAINALVQHAYAHLTLPASTASPPAFVTIAKRPSLGWDGNTYRPDLGFGKTEIFFQTGLDSISLICPSGCFVAV